MYAYKIFNKGLINKYGTKFELNRDYKIATNKKLSFGNSGYGYHIVTNLEDGYRYFDGFNQELDTTLITTNGNLVKFDDEYYDYYNMYVTDEIRILKVLNREEILDYMLKTNIYRIIRFISLYKLTDDEINIIKLNYPDDSVLNYINYYQYNDKRAFEKQYIKKKGFKNG